MTWGVCSAADAKDVERPNILVILADDLGYADLGVQGCKDIRTPNIDSIALNGIRFTNGYVSGPVCSPTRAALMSGQYQQRHGDGGLTGKPDNKEGLSHDITTVAERLRQAGYTTGLIGKWHLGEGENFPLKRGFDEFYGHLSGSRGYYPMDDKAIAFYMKNPTKGDPRIYRQDQVVADPEYTTDAFGDEAVAFIGRHREQPFFLYLSFNAVHEPIQLCKRLLSEYAGIKDETRRDYATTTAAMDEAVGKTLEALSSNGLDEKTIVFFLSDNGGPITWLSVNGSSNGILRGEKSTTWEGGVRVPFFVRWSGSLPQGVIYDHPVIQMDITATALALAGLELRPEWKLDGVNLMPYLTGKNLSPPHDVLFWSFYKQWAIRRGNWKLVEAWDSKENPLVGPMLFNLTEDVGETKDLSAQHPEIVQELKALHQDWEKSWK